MINLKTILKNKKNNFSKFYNPIITQIKNFKTRFAALCLLSLITSLFDGIGIGLIIPFFQNLDSRKNFFIFEKVGISFENHSDELLAITALILLFVLMKNVAFVLTEHNSLKLQLLLVNNIRKKITEKIFSFELTYFTEANCGKLSNIFMVQTIEYMAMISQITIVLMFSLTLIFYLFLLIVGYPLETLLFLSFFIPVLIFSRIVTKQIEFWKRKAVHCWEQLTSNFLDDIYGIKIIKSFQIEKNRCDKLDQSNDELLISSYSHRIRKAVILPFTETIFVIFVTSLIAWNLLSSTDDGIKHITSLIGFIVIIVKSKSAYYNILQAIAAISGFKQSIYNIQKILSRTAPPISSEEKNLDKFEKIIQFENVSFGYNQHLILKNLNFNINKGDRIGLVGRSGSGKTTLINLLLNFYQPSNGSILIDEVPLNKIKIHDWYNIISVVFQDNYMFNENIKKNITLYKNYQQQDIASVTKMTNLTTLIDSLPEGYKSSIGDHGCKISGGQKQRLAIARALLRKPEILILDEATSSLDSINENLISDIVDDIAQEVTILIIAHRLSTLKKVDKIAVLKDGVLVGFDSHDNLLNHNDEYQKLYHAQWSRN